MLADCPCDVRVRSAGGTPHSTHASIPTLKGGAHPTHPAEAAGHQIIVQQKQPVAGTGAPHAQLEPAAAAASAGVAAAVARGQRGLPGLLPGQCTRARCLAIGLDGGEASASH